MMDQILQTVITPDMCGLCNVKVASPTVYESHFSSKRHKKNLEDIKKKLIVTKVEKPALTNLELKNIFCQVCQVQLSSQANAETHYTSDLHKNNEDLFCEICSIRTASKEQIWNHLNGDKHNEKVKESGLPKIDGQYSPFCRNLPKALRENIQADTCRICNDSFATVKHALKHYCSPLHEAAVRHWFKVQRQREKLTKELVSIEDSVVKKQLDKLDLYCYICNINLLSKAEKDTHLKDFPHSHFAKKKSSLIKEGISEEFWTIQGREVLCNICGVKMCNSSDYFTHLSDDLHYKNYYNWYKSMPTKKVILDKESKWFYCRVCCKDLDGTSESDHHYWFKAHIKNVELYCSICELRADSLELLESHKASAIHLKNMNPQKEVVEVEEETQQKVHVPQGDTSESNRLRKSRRRRKKKNNENTLSLDSLNVNQTLTLTVTDEGKTDTLKNLNCPPESTNLKDKVFNELEELIQKLYYSKAVPYEIALEYLKQINKEVDEIVQKYDKSETVVQEEHSTNYIHVDNTSSTAEEYCSFHIDNGCSNDTDEKMDSYSKINYIENIQLQAVPTTTHTIFSDLIDFTSDTGSFENRQFDGQFMLLHAISNSNIHDKSANTNVEMNQPLNFSDNTLPNKIIERQLEAEREYPDFIDFRNDNESSENGRNDDQFMALHANSDSNINGKCAENDVEINQPLNPYGDKQEPKQSRNISTLINKITERKLQLEREYPNEQVIEKEVLNEIQRLLWQIEKGGIPLKDVVKSLENFNKELKTIDFTEDDEMLNEDLENQQSGDQKSKYTYSEEELLKMRTLRTFTEVNPQLRIKLDATNLWNKYFKNSKQKLVEDQPISIYDYYTSDDFDGFMDFLDVYLQT